MKFFNSTMRRQDIIERASMFIFLSFIFGLLIGFSLTLFLLV